MDNAPVVPHTSLPSLSVHTSVLQQSILCSFGMHGFRLAFRSRFDLGSGRGDKRTES